MREIVNVFTGEVKVANVNSILKSSAIGSCVVVTAYYPKFAIGGMAHIMLPGKAPAKKEQNKLRYTEDAINEMLYQLKVTEHNYKDINITLTGAGNVLKRNEDTICRNNIESVLEILNRKKLKVEAQALGGTKRRSVRFDIEKGEVYFTENDSDEMLLWKSDL